jgi:hypothetical protein
MVSFIVLSSVVVNGGSVSIFDFGLVQRREWKMAQQRTREIEQNCRNIVAQFAQVRAEKGMEVIEMINAEYTDRYEQLDRSPTDNRNTTCTSAAS